MLSLQRWVYSSVSFWPRRLSVLRSVLNGSGPSLFCRCPLEIPKCLGYLSPKFDSFEWDRMRFTSQFLFNSVDEATMARLQKYTCSHYSSLKRQLTDIICVFKGISKCVDWRVFYTSLDGIFSTCEEVFSPKAKREVFISPFVDR